MAAKTTTRKKAADPGRKPLTLVERGKLLEWRDIGFRWTEHENEKLGRKVVRGRDGCTVDPEVLRTLGEERELITLVQATARLRVAEGIDERTELEAWEALGRAAADHFERHPRPCGSYNRQIKRARTLLGLPTKRNFRLAMREVPLHDNDLLLPYGEMTVTVHHKGREIFSAPLNDIYMDL